MVQCERMPFGKVVFKRMDAGSVALEIDASYRPFFANAKKATYQQASGNLPSEVVVDCGSSSLTVRINGLSYAPRRESRNGRGVWVVNPYDKPAELLRTVLAR